MNSSVGQTLVPVAIFGKAILSQTLAPVPIKDHSVYGKINFSLKKSKKQKKSREENWLEAGWRPGFFLKMVDFSI